LDVFVPCKPGLDSLCAAFVLTGGGRRGTVSFSPDVNSGALVREPGKGSRAVADCREAWNITGKSDGLGALVDYCFRADRLGLSRAESRPGSLKWAVMRLRAALPGRDDLLWEAFRHLAARKADPESGCDTSLAGHPVHGRLFANFLAGSPPEWRRWIRTERAGDLIVAVNESDHNVTNLIFDAMPEIDVLVFRNPVHGWAGFVVRSAERRPDVDLAEVRRRLPASENWFLHPSGNILICGGPKAPGNATALSADDLLEALSGAAVARAGIV